MDLSTVFFYLFSITSVTYIVHLGFYLIGASFYDIWQFRRRDALEKSPDTNKRDPHVTVLVPAHNEEKVIVRCLNSIFKSTYRNFDVIVVNDASTDSTKQVIKHYVKLHPDYRLRAVHRRINGGKGEALNYGLRRHATGELVMMLDADSVLAASAIKRAVSYFMDPKIAGVAANVQIMNEHTTLSILQKFEHMIGYRAKKAYSLTNCEFVIGGVASTYRMDVIRSVGFYDTDTITEDISLSMKIIAKGNKENRIVYGADVMAMTEPVENVRALFRQRYRWKYGSLQNLVKHSKLMGNNDRRYTSMLTIYRLPMAVVNELILFLLPLTWLYAVYLTMSQNSLSLLLGAYLTVTVYMFLTLWYDEHLSVLERMYLTVYTPIAYFVFYVMDIIQIIAVTLCLFRVRRLVRREQGRAVWKSPARIGNMIGASPVADPIKVMGKIHE